jgi:hypothetical protein
MVSGIEEILEVYADHECFSAILAALGPMVKPPEPAEGERLADVIERRGSEIPLSDTLMTFDPPKHTRQDGGGCFPYPAEAEDKSDTS